MIRFSNVQELLSFSKVYVFRKRHLRENRKGCTDSTSFSNKTSVFLAMTTILFRRRTIFYARIYENVKIVHFPHFHNISYGHNTLIVELA